MQDPSDFLPQLAKYQNIAYEYLNYYLTDDQISAYLDFFHTPTTTHGKARSHIIEEHGHPETVYHALDALSRINALWDAVEWPNDRPVDPRQSFLISMYALQAGAVIGAIRAGSVKEQPILALAEHGQKFAKNTGRKPDRFTKRLESIVAEYQLQNGRFPHYVEVIAILKRQQGDGFIHTVDDDGTIEWGEKGNTPIPILKNKLSGIRKKIKSL